MEEIWKPVVGYEGLYEVSSKGRVKSLARVVNRKNGRRQLINEKLILPADNGKGYYRVRLAQNGKNTAYSVHRLVASSFIQNPDKLPEINHIDEDKSNNSVENLEWCDRRYNMNYGTGRNRAALATSVPIVQINADGEIIKEWTSCVEAARELGIHYQNIDQCVKGNIKQIKGYMFRHPDKV